MRDCQKNCIANVNGNCVVEECGGPIIRVGHHYEAENPEIGAKAYAISSAAFVDYFKDGGEGND